MAADRLATRLVLPVIGIVAISCGHFQARRDQALVDGIKADSLSKVQAALKSGADPNAPVFGGASTPLLCAIASNKSDPVSRKEIVETLLNAGADPSLRQRDGMDALSIAANMGDADLCERFCKLGLSPMRPAFKGVSALQIAAVGGDARCIAAMLPSVRHGEIDTPSAGEGHADSALGFACAGGRLEAARLLLDHGANPNFQDQESLNPLISASITGNHELVELLLSRGAKVDLPFRNGGTALADASFNGNTDIMKVLIAHGADVNHQNKSGVTPMMDAAMKGHHDAVEVLLKAGARADIRDHKGLTAKDYEKSANPRTMDSVRDRGEG